MNLIGIFTDPSDVGGLVDALKNSGIDRSDMIISTYDEEKFAKMDEKIQSNVTNIIDNQENLGEIETFVQGVKDLEGTNGIVVSVKCPRHKAQEVKSVMEQSGALEIKVI